MNVDGKVFIPVQQYLKNEIYIMKRFFSPVILIITAMFLFACTGHEPGTEDTPVTSDIVRKGNIEYDLSSFQTGDPYVPLMVSNGIVGGCFDQMGFQSTPDYGYPQGRTIFGYIRNYDRTESSRQIQFPLAIIQAEFADGNSILNLMDCKSYSQVLDIFDGVLTTQYDLYGRVEIKAFASQAAPNLFVMRILRKTGQPGKKIVLRINCETSKSQNNHFSWPVDPIRLDFDVRNTQVNIRSTTNLSVTDWIIKSNDKIRTSGNEILIPLENEENLVEFFIKREDCPGEDILNKPYDEILSQHKDAWHRLWDESWINFPDARSRQIWTRMKYYTLSCFPPIPEKPMIPTGLNSNIWGFTFPQDVYYVARTLPRLGHFDRYEEAMQYWLKILPDVKAYCRRIIGVEGAYYPWTPPFTEWESYEKKGVVSADSYELHNPAYVAAMVWQYYLVTRDRAFLEEYFPVLEEVCRYYSNISFKNTDGTYDIYHEKARGQDEASSTAGNLRNLLGASYSAEYTTRNYLAACKIAGHFDSALRVKAAGILQSGYTRKTLLKPEGWYATYEGDDRPLNSQKHPVQLNPIAYLPMPDLTGDSTPVKLAWQNRYELTHEAKKPLTLGWTIGEFALASCRMKDPAQLEKDLWTIQTCHGADPRWIQFYESSFWPGWHENKSYYFPMMALYLETFTDAVVQDWRGYTDLFGCMLPEWKDQKLSFRGIHTAQGISLSGYVKGQEMKVTVEASGATEFDIMITGDLSGIRATGMKSGPKEFNGNKVVHFVLNGQDPIILIHR